MSNLVFKWILRTESGKEDILQAPESLAVVKGEYVSRECKPRTITYVLNEEEPFVAEHTYDDMVTYLAENPTAVVITKE